MVSRKASLVLAFALIGLAVTAPAAEPTAAEKERARRWTDEWLTSNARRLPFSFRFGGRNSRDVLAGWTVAASDHEFAPGRTERTITFTDPASSTAIRCVATIRREWPAVDWVLWIRNGGAIPTPIIEEVRALDLVAGAAAGGNPTLHYARGSHALITDFEPLERSIARGEEINLASFGGRSSDGILPFFNLANPAGGGMMIDVGWTGQWRASFDRKDTEGVRIRAGMESFHASLLPGEEIRTPSIRLLFWDGPDRLRGQNLHRRMILECDTPRVDGRVVAPPICASPHAAIGFEKTTEANLRDHIRKIAAHRIPFDFFWIDAGWYTCGDNWARYVGNVDPDPTRFPRGLRPVADEAKAAGMKFLLWFEPERVMPGTWLATHHPDWLIAPPEGLPEEIRYERNDGFHLLDLGNPAALEWLKQKLSGDIAAADISCFRMDFNMYPLHYWQAGEPADRRGIREVRHVMGLYSLFDALRAEHPGLLLDNCASGGRRIDLEMLRRSLVLFRSDYVWDPVGLQCQMHGLARWIPITGVGAASLDVYSTRSGLGSHYTLAADYGSEDPETWKSIARTVDESRSLRPIYSGDFYPLSRWSIKDDDWIAWQFDRPDLGEGLVQAFRRPKSDLDAKRYRLLGLDPGARYVFTNLDDPTSATHLGRDLMESGLSVRISTKPGAVVLRYRKGPR
ncbi:alpha-galactosidase [Aquisphaera insulae]|uniref:alpha-galactosidase n=1 Tax=Aquisphaera insulae TaxID=2712864 RepID=UPI0013EDDF34|nr:alpha-galactosidase [Aquisphaera insulae]